MNSAAIVSLVSLGAIALAGCGGDDAVSVDGPWARATPAAQENGAVYFELTVDDDDTLIGASVPPSIAADAQIHAVIQAEPGADMDDMDDEAVDDMDDMDDIDDEAMDDMDDMDDIDDDGDHAGMAPGVVMREVDGGLPLVADETVEFAPGAYHVMLLDLAEPLAIGDEFELVLEFAERDDVTVSVPVQETAP